MREVQPTSGPQFNFNLQHFLIGVGPAVVLSSLRAIHVRQHAHALAHVNTKQSSGNKREAACSCASPHKHKKVQKLQLLITHTDAKTSLCA
jgi:hypothetical protein